MIFSLDNAGSLMILGILERLMSKITGNRGSLKSIVEFGKWTIYQNVDDRGEGILELPNEKSVAITSSEKYKSGQPLMAEFNKDTDTYEGQITVHNLKIKSTGVTIVSFIGKYKLKPK